MNGGGAITAFQLTVMHITGFYKKKNQHSGENFTPNIKSVVIHSEVNVVMRVVRVEPNVLISLPDY